MKSCERIEWCWQKKLRSSFFYRKLSFPCPPCPTSTPTFIIYAPKASTQLNPRAYNVLLSTYVTITTWIYITIIEALRWTPHTHTLTRGAIENACLTLLTGRHVNVPHVASSQPQPRVNIIDMDTHIRNFYCFIPTESVLNQQTRWAGCFGPLLRACSQRVI